MKKFYKKLALLLAFVTILSSTGSVSHVSAATTCPPHSYTIYDMIPQSPPIYGSHSYAGGICHTVTTGYIIRWRCILCGYETLGTATRTSHDSCGLGSVS